MGLVSDEENLQPLHEPPASRRLRWWFEPQLLHNYAFYCGSCRGFIMFFNGRLAAVCTLRFHSTNCCKQQHHHHHHHSKVALKSSESQKLSVLICMCTQPKPCGRFSAPVKKSRKGKRVEVARGRRGGRVEICLIAAKQGNLFRPGDAAEVSGGMAPYISLFISLLPSVISSMRALTCKRARFI